MSGPDPLALLTGYQAAAVLAAACETGVADALAGGVGEPAEIAARCGTDPRATRMLLGGLAALGLVRSGASGYELTEAGAELASDHPRTLARIVTKEWFFYHAWAGLPQAIRDGRARIPSWRERLDSDPETCLDFLRALDDLAARFAGGLPALVELPAGARVLDVGGGSGCHAAALERSHPGVSAAVLDLAPVAAVVEELHPGLAFLAGDLDAPRFGRPEGESWDAVLLANVLHDQPPAECARLVREAAGLVTAGGSVVLYEWVLDESRDSPPAVALFALMMLVENDGGASYTAAELTEWLAGAGLADVRVSGDGGPISVVQAWRS